MHSKKGEDSFFYRFLFVNKLKRAAIFSSQKGSTIYDCHLLECILHLTSQIANRPID